MAPIGKRRIPCRVAPLIPYLFAEALIKRATGGGAIETTRNRKVKTQQTYRNPRSWPQDYVPVFDGSEGRCNLAMEEADGWIVGKVGS
jgi:hypothetical protein